MSIGFNSNPESTPIEVFQQNFFNEEYFKGTATITHGRNEWKFGFESDNTFLNENFRYHITDPTQFDDGTETDFAFQGKSSRPRAICIRAGPDPSEELDHQCRTALGPLPTFLEPAGGRSALLNFALFSRLQICSCIFPMTGSFRLRPSKIYCFRVRLQLKPSTQATSCAWLSLLKATTMKQV